MVRFPQVDQEHSGGDEAVQELERRLARQRRLSARLQQTLEHRVAAVERSPVFRTLRWWARVRRDCRVRAGQWLLRSRWHPLYLQLFPPPVSDAAYEAYLEAGLDHRFGQPRWNRAGEPPAGDPVFSVLLACRNPRRAWLEAAVTSVQGQSYESWELCIADDASDPAECPWLAGYLQALTDVDPRIRSTRLGEQGGISRALNAAGQLATGGYIGVLDHDDELAPTALASYAEALRMHRADILYSDEDRLNARGRWVKPIFKPGWSPELLQECMYVCHFLVASREAIERAGWFRGEYDGAQDYDLLLRLMDSDPVVCHVPRVLYHWREHAGSTALDAAAKPWTHEAGLRALNDAARRRGWPAPAADGPRPNTYRVRWRAEPAPAVSIVICSRNTTLVDRCLTGIHSTTTYQNRRTVVVRHLPDDGRGMEQALERHGARRIDYEGDFHFARMSNLGAKERPGEALVFLNDDVTPIEPGWLDALVAQACRPGVGAVGARLVYPSGAMQHAGMAVGIMDGCGHPQRGLAEGRYWAWRDVRREVSAVTGACLAVRRSVFEELGGFDESYPRNYNDVDFCLRAREAGYTIIYEPRALLRHDECATRTPGTDWQEREKFFDRWGDALEAGDPFYNPNLSVTAEDGSLRGE